MGLEKSKIGFKTTFTGLIAFIADIEKHIHEIIGKNIPVYFLSTGDETYYDSRFNALEDNNEIYNQVPRVVFKWDNAEIESSNNNNNINIKYVHQNKLYSADSAKIPIEFPLIGNFVCSNFIFGLQYYELLLTIFNTYNVFTYKYMNNNYDGQYDCQTYSFEFPPMNASSEVRNFIINFNTKLQLPIYIAEYKTIQQLNPKNKLPINIIGNRLIELFLNEDGYVVDQNGTIIIDKDGNKILSNIGARLDADGYLLDAPGGTRILDANGNPIQMKPIRIDKDGNLIDKHNFRIVNDKGNLIDGKTGAEILDNNGNPIPIDNLFDKDGYILKPDGTRYESDIIDKRDNKDPLTNKPIHVTDLNNRFDANKYSPYNFEIHSKQHDDTYKTSITKSQCQS